MRISFTNIHLSFFITTRWNMCESSVISPLYNDCQIIGFIELPSSLFHWYHVSVPDALSKTRNIAEVPRWKLRPRIVSDYSWVNLSNQNFLFSLRRSTYVYSWIPCTSIFRYIVWRVIRGCAKLMTLVIKWHFTCLANETLNERCHHRVTSFDCDIILKCYSRD